MDTMELAIQCKYCNQVYIVKDIKPKDYQEWHNGLGLIQDVMPYLSAGDRELMVSRTCDNCWNTMFTTSIVMEDDS